MRGVLTGSGRGRFCTFQTKRIRVQLFGEAWAAQSAIIGVLSTCAKVNHEVACVGRIAYVVVFYLLILWKLYELKMCHRLNVLVELAQWQCLDLG